jgi:hypothetical protein
MSTSLAYADSSAGEEEIEIPPRCRPAGSSGNCLYLGQNRRGAWVVRDRLGLKAALFRLRADAMHFAREEASAGGLRLFLTSQPLELIAD